MRAQHYFSSFKHRLTILVIIAAIEIMHAYIAIFVAKAAILFILERMLSNPLL